MRQLIRVRNSKKKTSKIHALFPLCYFSSYILLVFFMRSSKNIFFGSPVIGVLLSCCAYNNTIEQNKLEMRPYWYSSFRIFVDIPQIIILSFYMNTVLDADVYR
eukprot:UN13501